MHTIVHDEKVIETIVRLVLVEMMNPLEWKQLATERLLNQVDMFTTPSMARLDDAIAAAVRPDCAYVFDHFDEAGTPPVACKPEGAMCA